MGKKQPPINKPSRSVKYVSPILSRVIKAYVSQEATSDQSVEWKAEARFVHSGKFWTASGVSAGIDMACGFVDATCGKAAGKHVREWAEYT